MNFDTLSIFDSGDESSIEDTVVLAQDPEEVRPSDPDRQKKTRNNAFLAMVAILAVGVFGGGGILWWFSSGGGDGAKTPTEAVERYLAAVAQGDARTALKYTTTAQSDATLLTSEVLKESHKKYPMANITVTDVEPKGSSMVMNAQYSLGEREVEATYTVQKNHGRWYLTGGFKNMDIQAITDTVPLFINGEDVSGKSSVDLFPGVYTLTTSQYMIGFVEPDLTIEYPENDVDFTLGFTLSSEGRDRVRDEAHGLLTECLTRKEIQPENCGFGFAGVKGAELNEDTISWTLENPAPDWTALDYTIDPNDFTHSSARVNVPVKFEALSKDRLSFFNNTATIQGLTVTLSDPYGVTVTFF
ncbi:MAG: hypothetical protein FWG15_03865 [Propionibacteriaceae bacterium]|jgi:hypothetical protein|nr:hypothetical protein [Propionibacteriaceae bacterium]